MVNLSFKSSFEANTQLTFFPRQFTTGNYVQVLSSWPWVRSILQTLGYALLNTLIVVCVAVPGAYAFTRWDFRGRNIVLFWLLLNRALPAAVLLIPLFALFWSLRLFDTLFAVALSHCIFNLPLAILILHGFMRAVPREIDETAYIDGYRFPRFFIQIFLPLVRQGLLVTTLFVFMFSWMEMLFARTVTLIETKPLWVMLGRVQDPTILAVVGAISIVPGGIILVLLRKGLVAGWSMGRVR
jgi:glycerol transport system permease protein